MVNLVGKTNAAVLFLFFLAIEFQLCIYKVLASGLV